MVTPAQDKTIDSNARYERLRQVYLELLHELETLEREGKVLSSEAQSVVDKEKMKTVLENILTK